MSMRSSSLANGTTTAITRETDSQYDIVKEVADNIETIVEFNAKLTPETIDGVGTVLEEPLRTSILNAGGNATIASDSAIAAQASEDSAELDKWIAEAEKMTADSYATEPEDTVVKVYTSNGDGTFTSTDTAEYSALHWAAKAEASTVQGVGISSVARTSGDGSPGTTDIYTVTLTDTTTYAFSVYNGANGQVESVAGRTGNIVLTKADVELNNVDNTSDLNKPISNATSTALGTKVGKSGNEIINDIKTFTSFPITPSSAPTSDYQVANRKFVIDNTPAINTSSVLTATAGSSVGAVGTYAFLIQTTMNTTIITAGTTYAGSTLRYSGIDAIGASIQATTGTDQTSGATVSGTWLAMGTMGATNNAGRATLFLRIA